MKLKHLPWMWPPLVLSPAPPGTALEALSTAGESWVTPSTAGRLTASQCQTLAQNHLLSESHQQGSPPRSPEIHLRLIFFPQSEQCGCMETGGRHCSPGQEWECEGRGRREGLLMGGVGVESVFPECRRRMWCWEGGVEEPSDSDGCALSQHFSFFHSLDPIAEINRKSSRSSSASQF